MFGGGDAIEIASGMLAGEAACATAWLSSRWDFTSVQCERAALSRGVATLNGRVDRALQWRRRWGSGAAVRSARWFFRFAEMMFSTTSGNRLNIYPLCIELSYLPPSIACPNGRSLLIMNSADVLALIEDLEDGIDDLEEDLEPLLTDSLSATTKKLRLLDKAKLYTLIVYAIESLLFCAYQFQAPSKSRLTLTAYLRLHGVAAKEHAVFKELTRVRQYFDKIKQAESGPPKPRENMSLNKEAAGRFIKHALVRQVHQSNAALTP